MIDASEESTHTPGVVWRYPTRVLLPCYNLPARESVMRTVAIVFFICFSL
jgi:hypothetical protein